jgi:predicted nucleic acid-binding protein
MASSLHCGATTVLSEDLQHNQLIDGTLRIVNPFLNLAMQEG